MGIIYKFENMNNGKVYIGQTIGSLRNRVAGHLNQANLANTSIESLQFAIANEGIECFDISILEKCDNSKLSEREMYYIAKYNSYENGYNQTLGGAAEYGDYYNRDRIAEMLRSGMSPTEITCKVGCSLTFIRSLAKSIGVVTTRKPGVNKIKLVQYNKNWEPIHLYNSITEAYDKNRYKTGISSFQHRVRAACGTCDLLYGYHWADLNELICNINGVDCVFRSPLDLENYNNGMNYKIEGGVVCTDISGKLAEKIFKCKFCGKIIDDDTFICEECIEKHPRSRLLEDERLKEYKRKQRSNKGIHSDSGANVESIREIAKNEKLPDKDTLAELVKTRTYKDIALEYGVSSYVLVSILKEYDLHIPHKYTEPNKPMLKDKLPPKETLAELIKTRTYRSIAEEYGVHEQTLRDQLRTYGIYEKRNNIDITLFELACALCDNLSLKKVQEIHNVSKWKIEKAIREYDLPKWLYTENVTPLMAINIRTKTVDGNFETLIAAMEWLSPNSGASAQKNDRYRIGLAAKSGKPYKGYIWKYYDKRALVDKIKQDIVEKENNASSLLE